MPMTHGYTEDAVISLTDDELLSHIYNQIGTVYDKWSRPTTTLRWVRRTGES